jgi:hypothetical protein
MPFTPKPKWKYSKDKKKIDFEEYLMLPEDKKVKLTIKNWNFGDGYVDGESRTVLRTDVIKMDGKEVNKMLVIKNYNNVQELKKVLSRRKSARDTADIEITRKYSEDDMDYYYEIDYL